MVCVMMRFSYAEITSAVNQTIKHFSFFYDKRVFGESRAFFLLGAFQN